MKQINLKQIGADIEMFVQNQKNGDVVSAEPYIKGSKYDPFKFDPDNDFYTTSLDNVMAEITIPPTNEVQEFVSAINKAVDYVKSCLPKNFDVLPTPSAVLKPKYLRSYHARLFGCQPDFNAYEMTINMKPTADNPNLRSAGKNVCQPM